MKINAKQFQSRVDSDNNLQNLIIKKEGFDFTFNGAKCSECGGKCCYGESGYIFTNISEMEQMSAFLKIPFEDFCLHYIKKVGMRFSLIEKTCNDRAKGVSCIFFDEESLCCAIYAVRPKQCRTFPFWSSYKNNKSEIIERCMGVTCCENI